MKRPSGTTLTSSQSRESKSHVQQAKTNSQAGNNKTREEARDLRQTTNMKAKSAALQVLHDRDRLKSVESDIEALLSKNVQSRGGDTN